MTQVRFFAFVLLAAAFCFGAPNARADEGWFSAILVGHWKNSKTGDRYHFRSDGGYTFTAGTAKRKAGNLEHSGRWRTFNPDPDSDRFEPCDWGFKLHATQRIVSQGKKRHIIKANKGFTLLYSWQGQAPGDPINVLSFSPNRLDKERFERVPTKK